VPSKVPRYLGTLVPTVKINLTDVLQKREITFKDALEQLFFKLMPSEILHYNEGKAKGFAKLFLKEPNLHFKEPCTSEQLEHVVCWIYASCLSQLPALVRQWWAETETKVAQIVEKVDRLFT
jgi:hypothetical protein